MPMQFTKILRLLLLLPPFITCYITCEEDDSFQEQQIQQKQADPKATHEKAGNTEETKDVEANITPKSPHTLTTNISILSDYRIRGISQTMRRPSIQGGFYYSHTSGIFLGTWASNVDGTTNFYNNTCMEWDFYGGLKKSIFTDDFNCAIALLYYYYPGGQAKNQYHTRFNTVEYYVELTYKWITIKYSQALTDYFGIGPHYTPYNWETLTPDPPNGTSRGSDYIELNLNYDLLEKAHFGSYEAGRLNLFAHVGHQAVRNYHHLTYTDWKITLTQEFEWLNLFITYIGTNALRAYFDVPDNGFNSRKCATGAQALIFGAIKFM